jgi:hypothetical protein
VKTKGGECGGCGGPTEVCGVRECFVPSPGHLFCSADYASGELCTLAQVCLWTVGESRMAEVINETRDPGALHTHLAARMLGVAPEEMVRLVKSGDKKASNYRRAAKKGNFGLPGGMGEVKFVLANRKKSEGETVGPDGRKYAGIRFCILLGGAERCGADMITTWRGRDTAPVCRACVEQAAQLKREWLAQWTEMPRYFSYVSGRVDVGGELTQLVSERVRGGLSFCDGANTLFQGLLADGAKRALWLITRECYDARRASPLLGSRVVGFFHDETFMEHEESVASDAGKRQAALMVEGLREFVPDVHVACDPALMRRWTKGAEPAWDGDQLIVRGEDEKKT